MARGRKSVSNNPNGETVTADGEESSSTATTESTEALVDETTASSGEETTAAETEEGEIEGTDDYSEVDQGVDSVPNLSDQAVDLVPEGGIEGGGGKGKGKRGKKSKEEKQEEKKSLKDKIRCSNCSNLMTQSEKMHYHEIPAGKAKSPQNAKGKPSFKGVGVAAGRLGGVLCDTCEEAFNKGTTVTLRTAVVERVETGEIENVPVASLLSGGAQTAAATAT